MEIEILYMDEDLVIVNKPPNLLVHPYKEAKQDKTCLMMLLKKQLNKFIYPIHRLDRPVSGVIVMGFNPEIVKLMQEQWHMESTSKKYYALVRGQFHEKGKRDFQIKNKKKVYKDACTLFSPLVVYNDATLLEVEIKTGRYHQIRKHFARTVNHVLGDRTYGKKKYNDYYQTNYGLKNMFLHSYHLEFIHPLSKKVISIQTHLPCNLQNVLNNLKKEHVKTILKNNLVNYE